MVRIVVPFPPASGPELILRQVAERLQKKWGQTVIVEGKPGGNGAIAVQAFKSGATDGHDLLLLDGSALALYPHLYKRLAYDAVHDFELLTPMFRSPFFVLVSSQSKLRSIGDVVAAAKAAPGKLNYGSWGIGSFPHLGGAMLATATDIKMEHVVYKDTTQMLMAVTTGELDFAFGSLATVSTYNGRMKAIAAAMPARHPAAPDVPTIAEAGGPAGFEVSAWTMFAAPKGLPPATLDLLKRDLDAALNDPEVKARLQTFGWETMNIARSEIPAFVATESTRYADIIRKTKLSLD